MPGKAHGKLGKGDGRGAPTIERGGPDDRSAPTIERGGPDDRGPDDLRRGEGGQRSQPEAEHGRPESPGRSASSPGHMKKAAGAKSARDFAPGHRRNMDQVDRSVVPGDSPEDLPLT